MRRASVSEAKNRLSALLREVAAGTPVTITDRGVPVARLVPVGPARGVSAGAVSLAQQGLLILPDRSPSGKWLDLPAPARRKGRSAVQALLAERRAGR
jgi:prevent-host-death family protein